jgi:tripartite-type tricarboxylate transporter receptor subunit TctC
MATPAQTTTFPWKQLSVIVSLPAGSSYDIQIRTMAVPLARELKQPVIVLNEPGVSATLGMTRVAKAAPDGHTVGIATSTLFRLPHMQKVNYDPLVDFTYIIGLNRSPHGIVVRHDSDFKTIGDLIARSKARPGKVSWCSLGVGTPGHIATARLANAAKFEPNIVPYKGGPEMWAALQGGHIDAVVVSGFGPFVEQGKVRLLATFEPTRTRLWPDVPTVRELGFDIIMSPQSGVAGPRGMDPHVVQVLHDAFRTGMNDSAYLAILASQGEIPSYLGSAEFDQHARASFANEKRMLDEIGFKPAS